MTLEEQYVQEIREEAEARRKGCIFILAGFIMFWGLIALAIFG